MSVKDHKDNSTATLTNKLKAEAQAEHEALLTHPSYIELQTRLDEAEAKANENWERVLRMQAEADNVQRRVERDVANAHKYALEKFVSELLPVVDNLERAISAHSTEGGQDSLLDGVNLTLKMFISALDKFGVQQVDPQNESFNPEFHQAVSTQENEKVKPNTVIQVLQKGYLLNSRLVRPALVIVSKAP